MPRHRQPDVTNADRGQSTRARQAPERLTDMTSPEVVQQRAPSHALDKPSRKRGSAPTYIEKLRMLVDRGECETDGNGWKRTAEQKRAAASGAEAEPQSKRQRGPVPIGINRRIL